MQTLPIQYLLQGHISFLLNRKSLTALNPEHEHGDSWLASGPRRRGNMVEEKVGGSHGAVAKTLTWRSDVSYRMNPNSSDC